MSQLPAAPGVKIIRHEKAAIWHDGYAFLKAASEEAAKIVAEAQKVLETARAKGIEEAKQKVETELTEQRRKAAQELEASLSGLEGEVVDLVMAITRQVIGTYPDAELVALTAKKAIAEFRHEKLQAIRVSPQAGPAVQATVEQAGSGDTVKVETDNAFGPGQIVLTGTHTVIDAGIDTQLAAIRESMARTGGMT
jgi:type III secretion protein L